MTDQPMPQEPNQKRDARQLGVRTYSTNDPLTFDLFNGDNSYENPKLPESNEQTNEQDEDFDFGLIDRNRVPMDSPGLAYEFDNYWLGLSD